MPDGVDPLSEPLAERLDQRLAVERVQAQGLPLLVRGLARLVEDLPPDLELPDVVEERRPVETVELVVVEPELLAEHVAVRSHALRVTPGDGIVNAECSREAQEDLRRFLRRKRPLRFSQGSQTLLQRLDGAGAQRELEPGRRLVGEDERQVEKRPQRKQSLAQPVAERHDDRCGRADRDPPEEEHPQRCRRRADHRRGGPTNASDTAIGST